jgi:hypothetical protein
MMRMDDIESCYSASRSITERMMESSEADK